MHSHIISIKGQEYEQIIFLNKFSPTFCSLKYIHMKYICAHICMYVVYTHIDVTFT